MLAKSIELLHLCRLPVLVDGDAVVVEFGACMLYILEKYAGMLPITPTNTNI